MDNWELSMITADVLVAGGGIAGLLAAAELAPRCSVVLIEQTDSLPRNKYWLTDGKALAENPHLEHCIDRRYEFLDFIAYDGFRARVPGSYCLWDTQKLVTTLEDKLLRDKVRLLTGHRLYSLSETHDGLLVRINSETVHARLLLDCMGFGSPIVAAKSITLIKGYYIMHGCEVETTDEIAPVALDNVIVSDRPAFFELFPTSHHTAHAAIILPSRDYRPGRSLRGDLNFILTKSHYSQHILSCASHKSYFGIIPVGRLIRPALDRIIFFGEAGQANPAASATGLSRMLRTYKHLADAIEGCLKTDALSAQELTRAVPQCMTRMNRIFQETLFESLLTFTSDDFRSLVTELRHYSSEMITDLVFADFNFSNNHTLRLAADAVLRQRSILGPHILKSVMRFLLKIGSMRP